MRVDLNVLDYLYRAELVHGDRVALVDEPDLAGGLGRITYRELGRRARGMAMTLADMGVAQGERVAIISPNAGKFLVAFFGVSGYGRILVPINFRLTPPEVRYVIGHSGATVLLIDPEYEAATAGIEVPHRVLLDGTDDEALFAPTDHEPEPSSAHEDSPASVNYTSGTTARPKGVELTHRNLWVNAALFGWHASVDERDVYLHTLPMFHCNGWGLPYAVTGMAGRHVNLRKVDGEEILARVEAEGVTFMAGAPAVVAMILDAAEKRRSNGQDVPGRDRVRIVVAGAPPPSKTIARVGEELGWEFIQIYGLTETSPLLVMNRATMEWDGLGSEERAKRLSRAGPPVIGVRMAVDEEGEILTRSNHVFGGYWDQPDETAKAMRDDWFHTGDGGYFEGPDLVIADRKKDVIISGGENVSSIEVEDTLYQHPAVAEAAVIGVPHEKWGETIKALVVLKQGESATEEDVIAFARSRMAHFKCPTSVEFRDVLARTATGKLQKFKLRDEYWEGRDRRVN